jgi:ArsR family transcriptional regulator
MACCPAVLQALLKKTAAKQLAVVFKVIADPARLRLLSFLAAQPDGEACVCNLMRPVGLSQPTVSHHLRVLHEAGFLDRERRGVRVYYRLRSERLAALREALAVPAGAARGWVGASANAARG